MPDIATLPRYAPLRLGRDDLDEGMVTAILEEAGKLASGVLAPLNFTGDQEGRAGTTGTLRQPRFREATVFIARRWNAVPFDPAYGGAACRLLSFPFRKCGNRPICPLACVPFLTKARLRPFSSRNAKPEGLSSQTDFREWTGTMNLTEPQAGSDIALVRTKATAHGDGTYRISGQKILLPMASMTSPRISSILFGAFAGCAGGREGNFLFIVPKFLEDGTRNDVTCVSLEHKLGIHASPLHDAIW